MGPDVGITRVKVKPAPRRRASSSASVRFSPLKKYQHVEVQSFTRIRLIGALQNHFDQQQSAVRFDRTPAVAEDPLSVLVIPVMDDVFHDIDIGAGGNRFEKIRFDDAAASGDRLTSHCCRIGHDRRPIGQHAMQSGICGLNTSAFMLGVIAVVIGISFAMTSKSRLLKAGGYESVVVR